MYNIYINLCGKKTGNATGLVAVLHKGTDNKVECELKDIKEWAQNIVDAYTDNRHVELIELHFQRI